MSYDTNEFLAEININPEHKNPHAANINPFYEMQKVLVEYKETESSNCVLYRFTIMVTGIGKRNLVGKLFEEDSDKNENTVHFLNYLLDIVRAASNVNSQGVLHGDIKPANMILVPSNDDYKVEFIDFDLAFRPKSHTTFDTQLKFTEGFRAPWIKQTLVLVQHDSQSEPVYQMMYPYSSNFTEDSYAIAQSMKAIFISNLNLINANDISVRKIGNTLEDQVIRKADFGPENVPTTAQIYEFIKLVIERREKDLEEESRTQVPKKRKVDASQDDLTSKLKRVSVVTPIPKVNKKPKVRKKVQPKYRSF